MKDLRALWRQLPEETEQQKDDKQVGAFLLLALAACHDERLAAAVEAAVRTYLEELTNAAS